MSRTHVFPEYENLIFEGKEKHCKSCKFGPINVPNKDKDKDKDPESDLVN